MNRVIQNGKVTPGHFAIWVTDGIVQDGGPIPAAQKVLSTLLSANFNTATDQPLLIPPAITVFALTGIIVANASVNLTTAVGGFWTGALKTGQQIVSPSQAYSALSNPDLLMSPSLTAFTSAARFSANNLGPLAGDISGSLAIYFSLTTPQFVPASADIYLLGIDLSP